MNQRPSLSQRGIVHLLAIVIGLGLLAVLAFSLNALFASRSSQTASNSQLPGSQLPSSTPASLRGPLAADEKDLAATWMAYDSPLLGFTFKHPADCNITARKHFFGGQPDLVDVLCGDKKDPYAGFSIATLPKKPGVSLAKVAEDYIRQFGPFKVNLEEAEIAGIKAVKAVYHQGAGPGNRPGEGTAILYYVFEAKTNVHVIFTGYGEKIGTGVPFDERYQRQLEYNRRLLETIHLK